MSRDAASLLVDGVSRQVEPAAREWLLESMAGASAARARVGVAVAGAGRRLGAAPANLAHDDVTALGLAGLAGVQVWSLERCARVALVLRGVEGVASDERAAFVDELFRTGDNDERAALLAGLCALPQPEHFVETAVEACRTNVVSVFEAVACDNHYPGRYFPEPAFNQMVLKAIFLEVSAGRILGLAERANAELARMVGDYASERAAAGRLVPDDVGLIAGLARQASR